MTPAPERRWFRFSLRTMLILVTVLGVALGVALQRARARREAIRLIDELGGGYGITIGGPAWLRGLVNDEKYFYNATRISFRSGFTDDDLARVVDPINSFDGPKTLDLEKTDVTDQGLSHLARVRNLERLRLRSTAVSDAGLVDLQALGSLRDLDVTGTNVTEEGVATLRQAIPACTVQH